MLLADFRVECCPFRYVKLVIGTRNVFDLTDGEGIDVREVSNGLTAIRSVDERSDPISMCRRISATRSGLKAEVAQVNIDVSAPTGISGCSVPRAESSSESSTFCSSRISALVSFSVCSL